MKLSEVFWEVAETFVRGRGRILTEIRSDLIAERAFDWSNAIHEKGAHLDIFI